MSCAAIATRGPLRKEQPSAFRTGPAEESTAAIRPFQVNVPDAELADLRQAIAATRWPEAETVHGLLAGRAARNDEKLANYWATEYDWRKVEARLNALPNFITEIDGLDIHFIHVRSKHEMRCRSSLRTAGPARSSSS